MIKGQFLDRHTGAIANGLEFLLGMAISQSGD
jgi:hypothetical protein